MAASGPDAAPITLTEAVELCLQSGCFAGKIHVADEVLDQARRAIGCVPPNG